MLLFCPCQAVSLGVIEVDLKGIGQRGCEGEMGWVRGGVRLHSAVVQKGQKGPQKAQ